MWLTKGVADEFLKFITKGSESNKQDSLTNKEESRVVSAENKPKTPQDILDNN